MSLSVAGGYLGAAAGCQAGLGHQGSMKYALARD